LTPGSLRDLLRQLAQNLRLAGRSSCSKPGPPLSDAAREKVRGAAAQLRRGDPGPEQRPRLPAGDVRRDAAAARLSRSAPATVPQARSIRAA
jgi:hypothetical protein